MSILGSISGIAVIKRRPRSYKPRDGGGKSFGGNSGFYLASMPRPYPINAPQRRVRDKARSCGIRKGMTKSDLIDKMINCIGGGGS